MEKTFSIDDLKRFDKIAGHDGILSHLQKDLVGKAVTNDYVATETVLQAFGSMSVFQHLLCHIANAEVLRLNDNIRPKEVRFFKNPNCQPQIVAMLANEGQQWLEHNIAMLCRDNAKLRLEALDYARDIAKTVLSRPQSQLPDISSMPNISIKDVVKPISEAKPVTNPKPEAKPEPTPEAETTSFLDIETATSATTQTAASNVPATKTIESNVLANINSSTSFAVAPIDDLVKTGDNKKLKRLCGPLIFENECVFLFGDTNSGKSILAVQIGENIAKKFGMNVVYFDFELSRHQFCQRYDAKHAFPRNFIRAELTTKALGVKSDAEFEERTLNDIERIIKESDAKMAIIDNLSYICMQSESGVEAGRVMKRLIELKNCYGLTLLVVAHTPKRPINEPLTQNSLAGSKRLANFADSMIAIGMSCNNDKVRYIKQVKSRSADIVYSADNVILGHIEKVNGVTRFVRDGEGEERYQLTMSKALTSSPVMLSKVGELLSVGKSLSQIAEVLDVSKTTAGRIARAWKSQHPQLPGIKNDIA